MRILTDDSKLNNARRVFSYKSAMIEQAQAQRKPLQAVEVRRLEIEAVVEIAKIFGVDAYTA